MTSRTLPVFVLVGCACAIDISRPIPQAESRRHPLHRLDWDSTPTPSTDPERDWRRTYGFTLSLGLVMGR